MAQTFLIAEVDMQRCYNTISKRLSSPYHHVDDIPSAKDSFYQLFPVLVGKIHIIYLQETVIYPGTKSAG